MSLVSPQWCLEGLSTSCQASKPIVVRYASSEIFEAVMTWVRCGSICFAPSRRQYERYCEKQARTGLSDVAAWPVWERENAR